jgi:non-specific serine/threonine protein kinase
MEERLALAGELGDRLEMAWARHWLAVIAVRQERYDEATRLIEDASAVFRALGDEVGISSGHFLRGMAAFAQGDLARAADHIEAGADHRRRLGDRINLPVSLNALALLRCELGDWTTAARLLTEALPLWREAGTKEGLAEWLAATARLASCRGQGPRAARLYGAADALGDALDSPLLMPPNAQYRSALDELRTALGAATFADAWTTGRALPLDQAIAEALAMTGEPAPPPDPAGKVATAGSLTTRERDVLRLVAEGRTDREIAATLFISERTVEWHLSNTFHKLGASTRAAAASAAIRLGVL